MTQREPNNFSKPDPSALEKRGRRDSVTAGQDPEAVAKFLGSALDGGVDKAQTDPPFKEKPKKIQAMLRIDPELLQRIETAAKRAYLSRNAWIISVVAKHLEREEERVAK